MHSRITKVYIKAIKELEMHKYPTIEDLWKRVCEITIRILINPSFTKENICGK